MLKIKHVDLKRMFPDISGTGYLTHGFDAYPAKMIPHMARFLIERVSQPGQTILDPFCGSGAVLIESVITGRNAIGVDFNPVAVTLAKGKTTTCDTEILRCQLSEILDRLIKCKNGVSYDFPNIEYWFTPATLRKLGIIRTTLDDYLPRINETYANFWNALALSIVRPSSRADTRGPKPFISKSARAKRGGKHFDPFKLFETEALIWFRKQETYIKQLKDQESHARVSLIQGDSRHLSRVLKRRVVDAIVTSPPYLNAQDYYRSSKLQRFIFGTSNHDDLLKWSRAVIGTDRMVQDEALLDAKLPSQLATRIRSKLMEDRSGQRRNTACVLARYVFDMAEVLQEIRAVLRNGSPCAIVLGYNLVSHIVVPTPELIIELASTHGLDLKFHYSDKIRDRWVPTIRNGHKGVINEEHLLIFNKVS
jgi:DNA modification methylase